MWPRGVLMKKIIQFLEYYSAKHRECLVHWVVSTTDAVVRVWFEDGNALMATFDEAETFNWLEEGF